MRGNGGCVQILRFILSAVCFILLFIPLLAEALEPDLEKELQQSLIQSSKLVQQAMQKQKNGAAIDDEIIRLKDISESIKVNHALLQERFRLRQEAVNQLGGKALERQGVMEAGYLKALQEYLILSEQLSAITDQLQTLQTLKTLLDKILPKSKRPIHGSLPYRNLNYPAREPDASPAIKPAYKGGNKVVSPDDTKDTEEAPLSLEIATLAQSLNWKPVAIYEYVKNNIETEWYWGCMKGAEETLRQKSGNDCDQATLLAALLRASGFPTRYVRGTIEFFAGGRDNVPMEKIRNLIGIDDPLKIAEFFQKAGIPYKPIIQGGKIANFEIEHIWVESFIPYGNYRGTMIDNSDPRWLGLDTSIKPKGYTYNTPLELSASNVQLLAVRDEYLTALQVLTPLEYLKEKLSAISGQPSAEDYKLTSTLVQERLQILPLGVQFVEKGITHEYTEIPEELKHKVKLSAFSNQQAASSSPLFEIMLPLYKLSNRQIALSYEPETVEDQQIIDSYGGLDNTPAYLVRLRPVLKVEGERVVVAGDGLPMGEDYNLKIELISPNGIERIANTHITGNVAAISIVAGKVTPSISPLPQEGGKVGASLAAPSEDDDAETILYKETNRYIDRWNQAEDELASLLHLTITRPIPTVVTVGGVIDVTYLLDLPHGFEWKGVFIDANLRAVSVQPSAVSVVAQFIAPSSEDMQKTFMQLAGLQGSVLEHKIFEDDLQVESISTAKLIQIVGANNGSPILTIDKTNIAAVLSASDLADNIKEDIINAVNQGLIVRIPSADSLSLNAISYLDWTGIGYIKENPETGEAGYMLSGMLASSSSDLSGIAGGMTAIKKEDWKKQDIANSLSYPNSKVQPNTHPDEAVRIVRLNKDRADYQEGIVGTALKTPLEVIAVDKAGNPVQGLQITFKISAGDGKLQGSDKAGNPTKGAAQASEVTLTTGTDGIARARLTLGQQTGVFPYYMQKTNATGDKYWELVGLNLVSVSTSTTKGRMTTDKPFEEYGKPGAAAQMIRLNPMTDIYGPPSCFASSLWVRINDQYGNSISDKNVKFSIKRDYLGTPPSSGAISAKLFGEMTDCPGVATIDCPKAVLADVTPFEKRTEYFGVHPLLIMGNTQDTKFTITAAGFKDTFDSQGKRIDNKTALNNVVFTFYTKSVDNGYVSVYSPYFIDEKGHKIDAGKAGEKFPQPITAAMFYTEKTPDGVFRIMPVVKNPDPGSPLKSDAQMGFQVALGGGGVQQVYYPELAPELMKFEATAVQTVEDPQNKGNYSVNVKLGDEPGKNRINAIGSVTTSTGKTLSAYFPIELWGVKLTVPAYQQLVLNSEGYPVADVEFQYSIDPSTYQFTPANVGLGIFERSATGSETFMGFVPADSNKKIILNKGMAKFDNNYTYYAQVVLNRGTREVRSEKIPLINAALIPDYDRNGVIDDADRERAAKGDKFYFWINDDDDGGETDGSDIPEDKMLTSFSLDHEDTQVDGIRDLIDFFPVYLDIKSVLKAFDPTKHKYVLKSEDASLNFVFTDLDAQHSGYYLTGDDNNLNIPVKLGVAVSYPISATGRELLDPFSIDPFLCRIASNTAESSKGIILLEGKKESITPLELAVFDAEQKTVFSMKLNLNMAGVEKMFRHKNLTPEIYKAEKPGPGSKAGEEDRLGDRINCPDIECLSADPQNIKNFIFLHGYNVNGQQARGWQSEMFKRMFWSGSKARFWGVTWDGWDTQEIPVIGSVPFTRNYHINVEHAFDTVPALRNFIRVDVSGEVTLAAHSLGNMVVSSMLTDNLAEWNANKKISNYFMLDAAVAAEAYGSRDDNNEAEMNKDTVTNPNMVHPDWTAYKKELWISEWHLLFKGANPIDNRESLTWRNIFSKRPTSVKYFNYYSSGEDVLDVHPYADYPQVPDILTNGIGRYAWALQEKLKGTLTNNGILGSNYGGWGFNLSDAEYRIEFAEGNKPIYPVDANKIANIQLRTRPFFSKGSDSVLFTEAGGSQHAFDNKIRLLADAIPARTLAAGKNAVAAFKDFNIDFDMQSKFKTRKTAGIYWPRQDERWLHSDLREVAYLYIYSIFADIILQGGLR